MTQPAVTRFSVVDDMFYRGHHGRGPSSVMQGVWRFTERVEPDDLAAMHAALTAGALTRRVYSSRVPFARRCLVGGARVTPLVVDEIPIPADGVVAWADLRACTPLDVDDGPVWELALGHVEGAGSVVTLSCSHLVTGGVGMVAIAEASLATGAAVTDPPPPPDPPRLRDDLRDALTLWFHVVVAVLVSLARACVDRTVRAELLGAARTTASDTPTPAVASHRTTIVDLDAEDFAAVVARENTSPTAVFVALVAACARSVHGRDTVRVAVPVAMPDGSVGSSVVTVAADDALADLGARIRRVAARAREHAVASDARPADPLAAVIGSPGGMPDELMQIVGDRIAARVTGDPGMDDGLASSLGVLPDAFLGVGGHPSDGLAVRAVTTNRSAAKVGVGAWMARSSARVTIAFDLTGVTDGDDVIAATLGAWGLRHRPW
ncbi:hypothetical protein [Williamsia serinedens]|uniref:Condensation domain-containing protein n=1 Tax=Williamsia serinedens TaxID=391736 RepID=A0ABT1H297_9NOCA|nr:hypothetical protein [Williamsia serinedens]MCP2160713.1 hypothetical protein [Williamsia serinedens]